MSEAWKLLLVVYSSSIFMGGYAVGLSWFGLSPMLEADGWAFLYAWATAAMIVSLAAGIPTLYLAVRPVGRAIDTAASRSRLTAAGPGKAVRYAMNLPLMLFIITFLLWAIPTLTLPISALVTDAPPGWPAIVISVAGTLGVAVTHAALMLYAGEWFVKRKFIPGLTPRGPAPDFTGARLVSLPIKITLLVLTAALIPTFDLIIMSQLSTAGIKAVLYLGITSIFYGIIQIAFIAWGIRNPLYRPVTVSRNSPQ